MWEGLQNPSHFFAYAVGYVPGTMSREIPDCKSEKYVVYYLS